MKRRKKVQHLTGDSSRGLRSDWFSHILNLSLHFYITHYSFFNFKRKRERERQKVFSLNSKLQQIADLQTKGNKGLGGQYICS